MYHNELEYLSMGMSGDFADAIRAGANMVRVGYRHFRRKRLFQIIQREVLHMGLMDELKKIIHPTMMRIMIMRTI